jgi:alkylhydroperoxidase family enzyme
MGQGDDDIEAQYLAVDRWRERDDYSAAEKLAIEFAERYCLDHRSMDQAFFDRMRTEFSDGEILDLATCCAMFLGLGRLLAVLDVHQCEPVRL